MVNTIVAPKDMNSDLESTQRFYTTGCTGKDVADLKPLIESLDAYLIDVRYFPDSDALKWRKDYLTVLLKRRYRHIVQLGNRPFRGSKVTIQNLQLGLNILASMKVNCVLLCGCADYRECHRFIIASELRRRGVECEEITDWKL